MKPGKAREILARLAVEGAMIDALASDSRRCAPGTAFLAYPGESADGRAHIADAIGRGASAVLWEERGFSWQAEWRVPNTPVADLKQSAGWLAHEFYGRPSHALWTCGVTGTNGKTSCSQWIAASLGARGVKTGVIGTLGSGYPGALSGTANTTPDALEVHRALKRMLGEGAAAIAMEVSSHGLVQGRVNGVRFACALFTNLSHDHLDYHGSMDAYAEAKARLFDTPDLGAAVLNLDDPMGERLAARLAKRGVRTIGYSLASKGEGEYLRGNLDGAKMQLESTWGEATVAVNALGRFNVSNALGVLGCLLVKGIPFRDGCALLEALPPVPGRMERIGERPLVVVDYAHTPDALEKVLATLRPLAQARGGKLVAVFGAGGDRDQTKRPLMGAAAARHAERVLVTSDNPRSEDPLAIIAQIRNGIGGAHEIEADRARAIERAIAQSDEKDVILIAGKGHESTQEIAGRRLPFSDQAVARDALARRSGK